MICSTSDTEVDAPPQAMAIKPSSARPAMADRYRVDVDVVRVFIVLVPFGCSESQGGARRGKVRARALPGSGRRVLSSGVGLAAGLAVEPKCWRCHPRGCTQPRTGTNQLVECGCEVGGHRYPLVSLTRSLRAPSRESRLRLSHRSGFGTVQTRVSQVAAVSQGLSLNRS